MKKLNIDFGAVASSTLSAAGSGAAFTAIDKIIPTSIPTWMKGVGKIVIGAGLSGWGMHGKNKNMMLIGAGNGAAAIGASDLIRKYVPGISGTNDSPISGIGQNIVIDENYNETARTSGVEEDGVAGGI